MLPCLLFPLHAVETIHVHLTAYVLVGEEIVPGELKVLQGARHVEEEGITTPAGEEALVASFGYPCLPVHRDRRSFDDYLPAVVGSGGLCALDAAQLRNEP